MADQPADDMHAHPPGRSSKNQGKRSAAPAPCHVPAPEDETAELRQRMEEQMLVNQALAVRVFAYARATEALHDTERRLHELIAHQCAVREDERQRLAGALHDFLAQNLLALRLDIGALHQETGMRHHRLHARVSAALENLDHTLRSVKLLLGELQPAGIELGLQAAIEIELQKFRRTSGIECILEGHVPDEPALPDATVLTVYRVLRECLDNVARHAQASQVVVGLACTGGWLSMTVSDNGIGFDPAPPSRAGRYSLLVLQERAGAGGGTLEVRSAPAQGSEIRLTLPLARPAGPAIG